MNRQHPYTLSYKDREDFDPQCFGAADFPFAAVRFALAMREFYKIVEVRYKDCVVLELPKDDDSATFLDTRLCAILQKRTQHVDGLGIATSEYMASKTLHEGNRIEIIDQQTGEHVIAKIKKEVT